MITNGNASNYLAKGPHMKKRGTIARLLAVASAAALLVTGISTASADEVPDQIVNGSFTDGFNSWNAYPGTPEVVDGWGCVTVPGGTGAYGAGIMQKVPLVEGEHYELTLQVRSEPANNANLRLVVQGGEDVNYHQFLPAQKLSLTPDGSSLRFTFTPEMDYDGAELGVQQDVGNADDYQFCMTGVSLKGGAEPDVYVPDTGPKVRVNQVGYHVDGPKRATLVTDEEAAQPWRLLGADDAVVAQGHSVPKGVDPSAGINVHVIDFTEVKATGSGFRVAVGDEVSYPFAIGSDLLDDLKLTAKTFFYTNRSGIAIDDALAPGYGRPAGHIGVAPNQGDTAVICQPLDSPSQKLLDEPWTCEGTRDVHGGWYDAGDHGKYMVNAGISVSQLMMEYERAPEAYADGMLRIPEAGNGVPDLLDEARWELEWMLRMQVAPGEQYEGMAYHKIADADWTGLPMLPSDNPQPRILYRPSTGATLNLAASAALGARLFQDYDADFSATLLDAARTAYTAAKATPELYAPAPDPTVDPNPGSGPYNDDDVTDEFYWAAAELYLTTGEQAFLDDVLASEHHTGDVFAPEGFDWGNVAALGRMQLASVPSKIPGHDAVVASVLEAADRYLAATDQPFGQVYGLDDYVWGSNSQMLNNMQVLGTAYDLSGKVRYAKGVLEGMDYILGRNALNLSYVTGYGEVDVRNQHSRWYAHSLDPSLPNPPKGTVAGGPNSSAVGTGDPVAIAMLSGCVHQFCYVDEIGSWSTNEITINWNSALSWVGGFLSTVDLSAGDRPDPVDPVDPVEPGEPGETVTPSDPGKPSRPGLPKTGD